MIFRSTKYVSLTLLFVVISLTTFAQRTDIRDNDFKLLVGNTGFGVGYEYNVYKRFYVEGLGTSLFNLQKLAAQGKYALVGNKTANFQLKAGLETAYFIYNTRANTRFLPDNKRLYVMPHITLNYSDLGLELSNIYERSITGMWGVKGLFPVVSITLNVTKSKQLR